MNVEGVIGELDRARGSRTISFLVLGDVIVDQTIRVEKLDRKLSLGDGSFYRRTAIETALGGVPTVARVTAEIGKSTLVIPRCDRGEARERLRRLIEDDTVLRSVDIREVNCEAWITPEVVRVVELDYLKNDRQVFRIEESPTGTSPDRAANEVAEIIRGAEPSVVLISDYGRGFVSEGVCRALAEVSAPTVLDPAGNWSWYAAIGSISVAVLRRDQLVDLCGHLGLVIDGNSAIDRSEGVKHTLRQWPTLSSVVIKDHGTASASVFARRSTESVEVRYLERSSSDKLKNRLGGGSAFVAYLCSGLALGMDVVDACRTGEAGAMALSLTSGPALPGLDQVVALKGEIVANIVERDAGLLHLEAAEKRERDFL